PRAQSGKHDTASASSASASSGAASSGAASSGAASRFDQVLAPSAVLHDARLDAPHDLNRPHPFRPRFASWDEWLTRRAALRQQVLVAEGLVPMPERRPLAPVIHGRVERDGYTIENVYFASYPGFYVTGNLYRPKGAATAVAGKYPA